MIDRERCEEMLAESGPDVPTYYIIKTYDVRGKIDKDYILEDVSEEDARDKFLEEVEGLEEYHEIDCKVELWTGKSYQDYQDMPGDQPPMQVTRIEKDELIDSKVI